MTHAPRYKVVVEKKALKGLEHLRPAHREKAIEFIDDYLSKTPLQPMTSKIKRLKGSLSGIMQYDLSRGDRIWWRVDEKTSTVYVLYVGPHPKETD